MLHTSLCAERIGGRWESVMRWVLSLSRIYDSCHHQRLLVYVAQITQIPWMVYSFSIPTSRWITCPLQILPTVLRGFYVIGHQ